MAWPEAEIILWVRYIVKVKQSRIIFVTDTQCGPLWEVGADG